MIAMAMGGRVAEELIFGKENITSGASSDISQATKLAKSMVSEWGYSDKLGQVSYGSNEPESMWHPSQSKTISEATAQTIDAEVRRLIDEAYDTAMKILKKKKKDWIALSEGLLEYETLSGDEINDLIAGKPPRRDQGDDTPPSRGGAVPKTGSKKKPKEGGAGDMEPQPQG